MSGSGRGLNCGTTHASPAPPAPVQDLVPGCVREADNDGSKWVCANSKPPAALNLTTSSASHMHTHVSSRTCAHVYMQAHTHITFIEERTLGLFPV